MSMSSPAVPLPSHSHHLEGKGSGTGNVALGRTPSLENNSSNIVCLSLREKREFEKGVCQLGRVLSVA